MEEYLETFITLLIGLVVFLISALGKKKNQKKASDRSYDIDFIDVEESNEEEAPIRNQNGVRSKPEPFTVGFESSTLNRNGINEQIGNRDNNFNDIQHVSLTPRKRRVKKSRKWFDPKKAIIYSEILNRKYY